MTGYSHDVDSSVAPSPWFSDFAYEARLDASATYKVALSRSMIQYVCTMRWVMPRNLEYVVLPRPVRGRQCRRHWQPSLSFITTWRLPSRCGMRCPLALIFEAFSTGMNETVSVRAVQSWDTVLCGSDDNAGPQYTLNKTVWRNRNFLLSLLELRMRSETAIFLRDSGEMSYVLSHNYDATGNTMCR